MNNVQPLSPSYGALVSEYLVELKGAYEGTYKVTAIDGKGYVLPKIYAWSGTVELAFITNHDIIQLLKEAIINR